MFTHSRLFLGILAVSVMFWGCTPAPPPADMVLVGGKIVTLDDDQPEATALAVEDGRIVALGDDDAIRARIGDQTRVIELEGKLAVPGFIEGHGHFLGIGAAKQNLDLMGVESWEAITQMVADAASKAAPGEWILGRGWHQEKWTSVPQPSVDGVPVHQSLSAVSPDNPVLLTHASGHASFANGKALEQAEINRKTPDPAGGTIVRDRRGNATGLLRETAQGLVRAALARDRSGRSQEEVEAETRRQVELAAQECLSKGLTSFQDAGSSFAAVDLFRKMAESGELPIRLWVMLREGNQALAQNLAQYKIIDAGNHYLTVRAIKRSVDGALGSHGAWLLEPYSDMPGSTGLETTSVESIEETAAIASEHGFQLCVHAIGDRANREILDLFEKAKATTADRWRIEHAQHLHPDDIPRFGQLGVIASMQAIHCTSDAPWVPQRLGPKRALEGSYVWQKLMQSGAVVTNGTDAPVEDVSPIASYYAAVSRKLPDGSVFMPEERMSREEALRSYTIHNAYAAFEEDQKGSLSVGKLADITVLDRDILTIPEDDIPATQVVYTIVGGKVEYQQ